MIETQDIATVPPEPPLHPEITRFLESFDPSEECADLLTMRREHFAHNEASHSSELCVFAQLDERRGQLVIHTYVDAHNATIDINGSGVQNIELGVTGTKGLAIFNLGREKTMKIQREIQDLYKASGVNTVQSFAEFQKIQLERTATHMLSHATNAVFDGNGFGANCLAVYDSATSIIPEWNSIGKDGSTQNYVLFAESMMGAEHTTKLIRGKPAPYSSKDQAPKQLAHAIQSLDRMIRNKQVEYGTSHQNGLSSMKWDIIGHSMGGNYTMHFADQEHTFRLAHKGKIDYIVITPVIDRNKRHIRLLYQGWQATITKLAIKFGKPLSRLTADERNIMIQAAEIVGLPGYLFDKLMPENNTDAYAWIRTIHLWELKFDPNYLTRCTQALRNISPITDILKKSTSHIHEVIRQGRLTMIVGGLNSKEYTQVFAAQFQQPRVYDNILDAYDMTVTALRHGLPMHQLPVGHYLLSKEYEYIRALLTGDVLYKTGNLVDRIVSTGFIDLFRLADEREKQLLIMSALSASGCVFPHISDHLKQSTIMKISDETPENIRHMESVAKNMSKLLQRSGSDRLSILDIQSVPFIDDMKTGEQWQEFYEYMAMFATRIGSSELTMITNRIRVLWKYNPLHGRGMMEIASAFACEFPHKVPDIGVIIQTLMGKENIGDLFSQYLVQNTPPSEVRAFALDDAPPTARISTYTQMMTRILQLMK